MTPSATSIAISPMLDPAQHSPNPNPDPVAVAAAPAEVPLERRDLVDGRGDHTAPAANVPCGRYAAYTATPASAHTAR